VAKFWGDVIFNWTTGKTVVKRWIAYMSRHGSKRYTAVRFITLVKIPDEHLVTFYLSAATKVASHHHFVRLCDIPADEKALFHEAYSTLARQPVETHIENLPEMVIGERLPATAVKWTKRLQVLYGREAGG